MIFKKVSSNVYVWEADVFRGRLSQNVLQMALAEGYAEGTKDSLKVFVEGSTGLQKVLCRRFTQSILN